MTNLFSGSPTYSDAGGMNMAASEFTNMTYYAKITETVTTTSETGSIPNALTWGDSTYKEWGHGAGSTNKYATLKFDMFEKRTVKSWMWSFNTVVNGNVDFDVEVSDDDSSWTQVATENLASAGPRVYGDLVGGDHDCRYIRFSCVCKTAAGVNMASSFIQIYV